MQELNFLVINTSCKDVLLVCEYFVDKYQLKGWRNRKYIFFVKNEFKEKITCVQ